MEYRELGRTGFKVSSISYGAWAIGGTWGTVDDRDSMASLHKALDLGINFFGLLKRYINKFTRLERRVFNNDRSVWQNRSLYMMELHFISPILILTRFSSVLNEKHEAFSAIQAVNSQVSRSPKAPG